MDAWFHGDNKTGGRSGASDIHLGSNTMQAHRSQLTMDTLTHANTHLSPIWHVLKEKLCWAVFTMAFGMCDHNTGRDEAGDMERRKERKWRKAGANKQNKLSKALCWVGAGTGECVCACEAMWTEWRGLGQILGCPTHSWLMIQSWSTAQRTSRHGTPGCVLASVCERVCLRLCVQARGLDWCEYRRARLQRCRCTNKYVCECVCPYYMYVFIRKEGRAIRNQTEAVCASCPPCLKASCDHLRHERWTEWKRGASKLQREKSKSCLRRLAI